jgi:hypothetical protein
MMACREAPRGHNRERGSDYEYERPLAAAFGQKHEIVSSKFSFPFNIKIYSELGQRPRKKVHYCPYYGLHISLSLSRMFGNLIQLQK